MLFKLDNASLFSFARWLNRYASRTMHKLIERMTDERAYAVWEVPYDNPELVKVLVAALHETFSSDVMEETLLFVNNGVNGRYKCYVAAGFTAEQYSEAQSLLNNIVGIVQDFHMSPQLLIALAVNGNFEMESNLTPDKVDTLYKREVPHVPS